LTGTKKGIPLLRNIPLSLVTKIKSCPDYRPAPHWRLVQSQVLLLQLVILITYRDKEEECLFQIKGFEVTLACRHYNILKSISKERFCFRYNIKLSENVVVDNLIRKYTKKVSYKSSFFKKN
jgi:hypothetical protein